MTVSLLIAIVCEDSSPVPPSEAENLDTSHCARALHDAQGVITEFGAINMLFMLHMLFAFTPQFGASVKAALPEVSRIPVAKARLPGVGVSAEMHHRDDQKCVVSDLVDDAVWEAARAASTGAL